MKFFAILAPLALLVSAVVADISSISAAVNDVNAKLNTLNDRVEKTDGTNLFTNLALTSDVSNLVDSLNTATQEFESSDVLTVEEADPLLKLLNVSKKTTKAATDRIIAIKPGFQSAGVVGIVRESINNLDTAVASFADAAVAKVPAEREKEAKVIQSSVLADIDRVQAAFSDN